MEILTGQKVSSGIAMGQTIVLTSDQVKVKKAFVRPEKVDREVKRFRRALSKAENDIKTLMRDQASAQVPVDVERIIATSLDFLSDAMLSGAIEKSIREELFTAPYAVSTTVAELTEQFKAIDNPAFSSKVADMIDIEHRLLNHLMGGSLERVQKLTKQLIVIADDLTPSQAVELDRDKVLGIATEEGSWASHTAILARALGIPAVVAVPGVAHFAAIGSEVIVDGDTGTVIIDPDAETIKKYRDKRRRNRRVTVADSQIRSQPSITKDGEEIRIYCNIETKEDIPRVKQYGGTGVGLFRTEFLFLGRQDPLSEDGQFEVYREALEGMEGKMVTIRTMDVGADKFHKQYNSRNEPNPFLGERSIRVSFKHPESLKTQMKAVLRAGLYGKVRMMFPLIMDLGDFRRAKAILAEAKAELSADGVSFETDLKVGAMIELPSAVMNIERLVTEVDFCSIGTNDLTQYTLGVDRLNHRVAGLFASHHPAILQMIKQVVRVCRRAGKYVSICGEMAAEPLNVPLLLGLGVRNLSVAPPMLPRVKRMVRSLYLSHCHQLADSALVAADADEVMELLLAMQAKYSK
ncbi:MAG: phosphotransferase system enzyme I (PtsI) [Planctomycetota bacterium]|jgi:phosphotransferase system enzyme I (PtsI)